VAEADDDAKDALGVRRSDRDLIALVDAMKTPWHRRHKTRVVPGAAFADLLQRLRVAETVAREVMRRRLAADAVAAAGRQIAAKSILGRRHPQRRGPALPIPAGSQPVCKPKVIRMKMRGDDSQQRLARKRTIEQLFPRLLGGFAGDAAIDERIAGAPLEFIVEQP